MLSSWESKDKPPFRPAAVRSSFLRYPSMRREPSHLARPTPERLIAGRAGMLFTQEAVTQQMLLRSAIILSGLRWSAVSFRCIEPHGSVLCRVSVWQITHLTKRRRQASRDPYLNGKIVVSAASLELLCSRASAWPSRRCARATLSRRGLDDRRGRYLTGSQRSERRLTRRLKNVRQ